MSLINYIIRRLGFLVFVLFGVSLLVFTVMMLLPPGQRAASYINSEKITPEQMDAIILKYGLNDPAPQQYVRWIGTILSGGFGYSTTAGAPVSVAFAQYFPTTLELVLFITPLIIFVGVGLGTWGAVRKDRAPDHFTRIFAIVGYSLPTFWLGLLLLMVFYGFFGLFPPGTISNEGRAALFAEGFHRYTGLITVDTLLNGRLDLFADGLYRLVLPTLNLVLVDSALIMRLTRSSMLEALGQDYMITARAKGADRRTLFRRHARKNALLPVITVSGVILADLLGGLVITETIFDRKGLGWWMARAAIQLDVSAIMFNVLFLGAVYVVINLIVDIIYAYVDPRVRLS